MKKALLYLFYKSPFITHIKIKLKYQYWPTYTFRYIRLTEWPLWQQLAAGLSLVYTYPWHSINSRTSSNGNSANAWTRQRSSSSLQFLCAGMRGDNMHRHKRDPKIECTCMRVVCCAAICCWGHCQKTLDKKNQIFSFIFIFLFPFSAQQ